MILKQLVIRRGESWDRKPKELTATIEFVNEGGKVQIELGEEVSQRLLDVCADQLVEAATVRADAMRASILDASVKALPTE